MFDNKILSKIYGSFGNEVTKSERERKGADDKLHSIWKEPPQRSEPKAVSMEVAIHPETLEAIQRNRFLGAQVLSRQKRMDVF